MVYNRCVGTHYCANNCPYKVRRYNYLQFAELAVNASELSLAHNPDVTVRSRGVMEKCTYCTQRISAARIQAGNEGRRIRDGEVVTACQSACPSEAIVFGDLNDPDSAVVAAKASVLDYKLLEELNTVPRTSYLARVGNPHPDVTLASRPVAPASRPVASSSRTGSEGVL
jgi:molybdopterin-containing oxidoreductase family iron-sulfur binding subunit